MNNQKKLEEIIAFLNENTRFKETKNFIQHGNTSVYYHVISVAKKSIEIVEKYNLNVDMDSLIRGALLHDYFLYDWHDGKKERWIHGFTHPMKAYLNAKSELKINRIEKDIIIKHMFPLTILPPKYLESWIVTYSDKYVSIVETVRRKSMKVGFENL
ncbi:HD domain-containing protein [Peptoniphilus sp. AGMB00490]|uniref:HD domain-containing protein n=2 Tax=Peptoniphilus TaxID=162289 RepID=A0ACD6AZ99_9FIRM|nr:MULTISPECIES: HD domain-containing protein [Peptoniphilus]NMW85954.1 HD domain-containing protein [Peptoniphilus faecalis]OLR64687.1 phosphohydrolase [Peptoniphilus porci]